MQFFETVYANPLPAEEGELTTTAGHEAAPQSSGLLGSLGINVNQFAFQLINFAVVAIILWYLILKPVTKKMGERAKMIDDSIENAKKVEENLARSEQKYQEKIDMAKVEANRILEKANAETEIITAEMKEKAKKEINLLVEQAKKNIKLDKEEMVLEIKKDAAELVAEALKKVLGEKIDDKKDAKLIEESLAKIEK